MVKYSTFLFFCLSFFYSFNQLNAQSACPQIDKLNNGNGQWASAPGDFRPVYAQNNLVTSSVVGTKYQFVNVNPNTKTGDLTFKWDNLYSKKVPVITKVFHTDAAGKSSLLSTVFGPAAPVKSGEDKAVFCFYGTNLPSVGTLTFEFTDPTTAKPINFCSFDAKKLEYVKNPTLSIAFPKITTHPTSKTVLGDGSTSLTVDAVDASSYKWQYSINGTTWSDVNSADFISSNNTLQINNRIKYDKYSFRVILTNIYGSITTNSAVLTVDVLPTVSFTSSLSLCNIQAINAVSIQLTGVAPWSITYSQSDSIKTITAINSSSFSIPFSTDKDVVIKLLSVSDSKYTNESIANNTFNGYVKPSISITNSIGYEDATTLKLNFVTTGNPNQYILTRGNVGISNFDSATNAIIDTILTFSSLKAGNYDYSIKVRNTVTSCESEINNFNINILENPISIVKQPLDTAFFLIDNKAVIYASANNAKSYIWQKSVDQGLNWNPIEIGLDYEVYKDSLIINNSLAHSKELFRVVFSNNSGSVTSNTSLLFIEQMPVAYFKSTVHCDVNILKAVPVLFEGLPPFELVYQVEGVPGEEAHFVPNIKTNVYNIIVGGLTKQTNIKLLKVNNKRYVNTSLTKDALFTSFKKNTITSFVDTLIDEENQLVFKTTGDAYKTFSVVNGTTTFPNFTPINNVPFQDSLIKFTIPNTGEKPGRYNFTLTMNNSNGICYNSAKIYITVIQNKLAITSQPISQSYLENGKAIFSLKSQYSTSYLWQYTFNDGATWNDITQGGNFTKVTKDTLEIENRLFYKNNKFRIVLYGKYENVTSNTVNLVVERKPIAFFETSKKCYLGKTKTALVYFKGLAPFKISYINENGFIKIDSNITKDVYTLQVDSSANKLRLLSVSDARFQNVSLDSSNVISFFNKPIYRPYFKTVCIGDSLSELLFSGSSQPKSISIKSDVNPIPGFATINDSAYMKGYKLGLPKKLSIGTYGFVITGSDGTCTSDEVKTNISMYAIPIMNASSDKTIITKGDSVLLSSSGADVVRWSPVLGFTNATAKSLYAKPESTTTYTSFGYTNGCVGKDTVKIIVNSVATPSNCSPISLQVLQQDIKSASCNTSDGSITFTIAGGSENNKYRIRKKNNDGTFTIITNPTFTVINNQLDESKTITTSNLSSGTYDIFALCGSDVRVTKIYNFAITSPCDSIEVIDTTKNTTTPTTNYTCEDMVLSIDNTDIKPITCDYDFGSVTFTIQGGAPNFTYRLRRRNQNNTYTIITNPVFVSIRNKANELKKITIDELTEGEYDLYVYCSQDVTYFKSMSFNIYKEGCRSLLGDVISYYSFDKNNSDSLKRASAPSVTGAVKDFDNYGNKLAAFKIFNATDNLTFSNFVDIDTMSTFSISFWYKLLEMPKFNNSTLISIPNGNLTQRLELVADKNGYMKVQFGKTSTSATISTNYKFEPSTWNQIVLTHRQDSNLIFVNDIQVASFVSSTFFDNNTDVVVGYDGKNKSLKFLFDEFKLYGKAITAEEVKDIYFSEVRENCTGIRLNIEVEGSKLKFVVANGSYNNKYRLRKKNGSGVFVSVYDQTFVSIYNKLGESRVINTDNLSPGIYDVYAYCGSDSKKYQGYEFIVDNRGEVSIYRKITPTETINMTKSNSEEQKEEIYVNVYPNPVDNIINVDVIGSQNNIEKTIRLISSNGVIVHSEHFNTSDATSSINVEHLRAGVYFLEIQMQDNRVERKQIVIN